MIWEGHIFSKLAQNGARRDTAPGWLDGARRTLCALSYRLSHGRALVGRGSASAAVAVVLLAALPLAAGSVVGQVELKDSNIASVRKGRDYSGVVVWLLPADGGPASR